MFCKKAKLKNLAKFTGKHLCESLFFNKVAGVDGGGNFFYTLKSNTITLKCFGLVSLLKKHQVFESNAFF